MLDLLHDKYFWLLSFFIIISAIFFDHINIIFNYTHSLPQKIFIVDLRNHNLRIGDYVAFKAKSLPNARDNTRIIKRITGISKDIIQVKNYLVYRNHNPIAKINYHQAFWGEIHPINNIVIPQGCYFVQGISVTSFDSRYKEFGLVCQPQIIGKAYPLF
jgi:conjugal transfer pilin signal peptidase TrbI